MTEETTDGPRTYQSAWQFGENDAAVLLTAEAWLEEEADVDEALGHNDDEGPSRGGIMRAIAKEIATLRAERSQWAEAYSKLAAPRSEASSNG